MPQQHPSPAPPVGRLAPTPSGQMHLGNAFAALLCWLSIRSQGGRLLLRMENLDPLRTSPAFAEGIMADLAWLGLDWDERSPDQLGRTRFYEAQLAKLKAQGLLYPCFCSRAELHVASAPHASDGSYVYGGACRGLAAAQVAARQKQRGAAVRVRVPDETVFVEDGLQGRYAENLQKDCGDFILRRSDGVFAYQLAAPADDGDAGVSEIMRGRDLLPSASRQLWLGRTLGLWPAGGGPRFIHLPLLLAPDGRRLAKRDADLDLAALRQRLKTPERLVGRLAHLAGLLPKPEAVTAAQLVGEFHLNKLKKDDIIIKNNLWEDCKG